MTSFSENLKTYLDSMKVSDLRVMSRTGKDGNSVSYESIDRLLEAQKKAQTIEAASDEFYGQFKVV